MATLYDILYKMYLIKPYVKLTNITLDNAQ